MPYRHTNEANGRAQVSPSITFGLTMCFFQIPNSMCPGHLSASGKPAHCTAAASRALLDDMLPLVARRRGIGARLQPEVRLCEVPVDAHRGGPI